MNRLLVAGRYIADPQGDEDIGDGGPATEAWLGGITALHLSGDEELLIAGAGSIRIISTSGVIDTLEDDDVESPYGVVGGRGGFAVADLDGSSRTVSLFGGLSPGEHIIREDIDPHDLADAGPGLPGSTYRSLWVITEAVIGLLSDDHGTWTWSAEEDAWNPQGVGERTGGGALYATYGGFGANQDCRVYAKVPPGGSVAVAGEGSCAPGGPVIASRPAKEVALNYPQDVEGTPDGGFVIAEQDRLSRVAPDGTFSVLFSATGPDDLMIPQLNSVDVTPDGDVVFSWGSQIWRYDGNFTGAPGPVPTVPNPNPAPVPNPNPSPPPTATKLTAALAKSAYALRKGKRLRLTFQASQAGSYRLDVLRRGKRVKRLSGKVRSGANTIAFKAKLRPGRYKLALTLTAGGKTATDTARLRIRR